MAMISPRRPWPIDPIFDASEVVSPRPTVHDPGSGGSTLDDLLSEFTECWSRGLEPRAEAFLPRLASVEADDAVELIYHEFCLAEAAGRAPDPEGFFRRFPDHGARLARLLGLHATINPARLRVWSEPSELPAAGDEIGPYRLIRELGRGAFARVFLAEQADLSDRLVVLKVAARASVEPQLLARARHPHIVEVLRHGEADAGALHLICMPFLGGHTLSAVLGEAWRRGRRPRSGRALLAALDRVAAPEFGGISASSPARELVGRTSYARAITWLVARLAEALDHAQRRGVSHGDLKPSNVLIAADGRPMLLDFNLSIDWSDGDDGRPGGGTLAYMAPERLRALADPITARPPRPADRHRADLYALGLLLREALTGEPPAVPDATGLERGQVAARLAESREQLGVARLATHGAIPAGLRPIVAKLLATDPADRYAFAAHVVDDLDRWRLDRPLNHADEPAAPFRLARWMRRQRLAVAAGLLVLGGGGAVGFAALGAMERSQREVALAKWDRILSGIERDVYDFRTYGHTRSDLSPDRRAEAARRHLASYGLGGSVGRNWRERDDVRALPDRERDDLELWLLEQTWRLATVWADRPGSPADWRRALIVLEADPSWSELGPIAALRRTLRDRLGRSEPKPAAGEDAPQAPEWVASYLCGLAAEGQPGNASLEHFERTLEDRPRSYWARYRASAEAYRLGRFSEAATHLARCQAIQPGAASLYAQQASCLTNQKFVARALELCDRAIDLDPDHPDALWNRAIVRGRLGQVDGMNADLERFTMLSGPESPAQPWYLRLAVGGFDGLRAFDVAKSDVRPVLAREPDMATEVAVKLDEAGRDDDALAQYDLALRADPDHLLARYSRGMLRAELRRPEAADDFQVVVDSPRFEDFLRQKPRAMLAFAHLVHFRLREGRAREALEPARRAVALSGGHGDSHYDLARVYAVLARSDGGLLADAAEQLRIAHASDPTFVHVRFLNDATFEGLRAEIWARLDDPCEPPTVRD